MNRSEANEEAKKYISNAGYGTGTNITLHGLKCMMVDFYLDHQVKNNVVLDGVSTRFLCHSCNTEHTGTESDQLYEVCHDCFCSC